MNTRPQAKKPRATSMKPNTKGAVPSSNQGFKTKIVTLSDINKDDYLTNTLVPTIKLPEPLQATRAMKVKLATHNLGTRTGPKRIGHMIDPRKWRCNICSFMNEDTLKACKMCESEKGAHKERKRAR